MLNILRYYDSINFNVEYVFLDIIADRKINIINDKEYFDKLRDIRYSLALENFKKPYQICSDAILREICSKKPKNLEELKTISGIGDVFIEKYSKSFLGV